MTSVRKAIYLDVPRLVPLMNQCFEESEFKETFGFGSNENDTMQYFASLIKLQDHGFFVAENDGKLVGFLVVYVRPWVMNFEDLYACEMFFYVDPKHRDGKTSRKLIKFYEDWAKEKGCKAIEFGVTEKMKGKKMANFLTRLGFEPAIRSHIKKFTEVQHGNAG